MIKILLSLTIWLRKYQGRGGNYYTIGNATSILVAIILATLFLVIDLINNHFAISINMIAIIE